jgi:hypothetical protein
MSTCSVELVLGVEEGEGVVVGLADELAAAGVGELFEEVDDVGAPGLELVEADAGDGVGDAEVALVARTRSRMSAVAGR